MSEENAEKKVRINLDTKSDDCSLIDTDLIRHTFIAGSTGSGKTRLAKRVVEDIYRSNLPVFVVDPQGDWGSIFINNNFDEKKLWIPGLAAGERISILPSLDFSGYDSREEESVAISLACSSIAGLLGYDLRKENGKFAVAALSLMIEGLDKKELKLLEMADFIEKDFAIKMVGKKSQIIDLCHRLRRQEVITSSQLLYGDRKICESTSDSIDNNKLTILDVSRIIVPNEQAFIVSVFATEVFRACQRLCRASKSTGGLKALLVIDEAATFVPPVYKTACKEILRVVLKQGRKYGLGCILISQSPGDVDYKIIGQVNNYLLGKLTTLRELSKVIPIIRGVNANASELIERLPGLKQESFIFINSNNSKIIEKARCHEGEHRPLTDEEVKTIMEQDKSCKNICCDTDYKTEAKELSKVEDIAREEDVTKKEIIELPDNPVKTAVSAIKYKLVNKECDQCGGDEYLQPCDKCGKGKEEIKWYYSLIVKEPSARLASVSWFDRTFRGVKAEIGKLFYLPVWEVYDNRKVCHLTINDNIVIFDKRLLDNSPQRVVVQKPKTDQMSEDTRLLANADIETPNWKAEFEHNVKLDINSKEEALARAMTIFSGIDPKTAFVSYRLIPYWRFEIKDPNECSVHVPKFVRVDGIFGRKLNLEI